METFKIKTKIGQSEFEAEGPTEAVTAQFEAFLARISSPRNENTSDDSDETKQDKQNKQDTVGD